jgi:hypothetical protein
MSKKKWAPGYPAERLEVGDVVAQDRFKYVVATTDEQYAYFNSVKNESTWAFVSRKATVRLIRKANGPTYETWQRKTSKLLKTMGLSRWPGTVMHQYFFDSVSPEEAAAGFMADHFLINEQ